MPPMTFPHQRTVKIHREVPKSDFLGIKNENWKAAARDLSAHAFKLYIYLASNADRFTLALSPAAVRQEIGMARSTYHDQFHVLVDKGYLVNSHGSTYEFFERPKVNKSSPASVGYDFEKGTLDGQPIPAAEQPKPQTVADMTAEDTEINIDNTNTTNIEVKKQVSSPLEKEFTF